MKSFVIARFYIPVINLYPFLLSLCEPGFYASRLLSWLCLEEQLLGESTRVLLTGLHLEASGAVGAVILLVYLQQAVNMCHGPTGHIPRKPTQELRRETQGHPHHKGTRSLPKVNTLLHFSKLAAQAAFNIPSAPL